MHTTPASLLEQVRRLDDQQAWHRFVDLYTPLLFHWARRVGLQEPDAADLVQDVFILLVKKLPEFHYDGAKGFRAWLRTVALNRWRETRRRAAPPTPVGDVIEELPDPASDDAFWEVDYRREAASRAVQIMKRDFDETAWQAF
jgi:RNA polymerase sigma-70 factor (ECF subfamily)